MSSQVANRGKDVFLRRRMIEISLTRTRGAADPAEIDGQDAKSFGVQSLSLVSPTLLAESAAVRQHNCAGAAAVEVGAN
jgi:hypothetical protein